MTEASNIVNDELPVAVMHFSKANIGYSDRLQNFKPSSWGVDTSLRLDSTVDGVMGDRCIG